MLFFNLMSGKKLIPFFLLLILSFGSQGQRMAGAIRFTDTHTTQKCFSGIDAADSLLLCDAFKQCLSKQYGKGFLEARIDSVVVDQQHLIAYGFKGHQYVLHSIEPDSITEHIFYRAGVRHTRLAGRPLAPGSFSDIWETTIGYLENNGYPFASLAFYDVTIDEGGAEVKTSVNLGPKIILDTLYLKGEVKINRKRVEGYLRFKKGNPYNQALLSKIDNSLAQLPFMQVIKPGELEFTPGKVRVHAYLGPKSASHFSGIIGFATKEGNTSGVELTGDVNLKLTNAFRWGEVNSIKWQALTKGMQRLEIATSWPYIFSSDLALSGSFNLLRRDSTYQNMNPRVMALFRLPSDQWVGVGVNYKSSATHSAQEMKLSGYSTMLYTLEFLSGYESSEPLPISKVFYKASLGAGKRSVNSNLIPLNERTGTVGEGSIYFESYAPLYKKRLILYNRLQGAAIRHFEPQQQIMENETFLIGGSSTLRGFNDESIAVRQYIIGTIELQYRIQNALNFSIFSDFGYASYQAVDLWTDAYPRSTGVGIYLLTKGGVVHLSYAVGYGFGQTFSLTNSKVHVGYIATF